MALIRRCVPIVTKTAKLIPHTTQGRKIHRYVAPTLMELKRREDRLGGKVVRPRNTFLEFNLEAELFAFGRRLGEAFDSDLLLQAFTDRSYVIKEELKQQEVNIDIKMKDNRELAQEGEDFMKAYIQSYLEHILPKFPLEGIAGIRQHLMSEAVLSLVSSQLGTKDLILAAQYPVDAAVLAQTLKAVVGALRAGAGGAGEERAGLFVRDFVITQLNGKDVNDYYHVPEPWAALEAALAQAGAAPPEPRLLGAAAARTVLACYRVGVYVDKKMIASGFGESVLEAREQAARAALRRLHGAEPHAPPLDFTAAPTLSVAAPDAAAAARTHAH